MPVGTVTTTTERFELETLPGAFIVVRRMTYGEKLKRQDEMLSMKTKKGEDAMEISTFFSKTALRDFHLVVEHNITDENDRVLNFRDAKDVVALDPRVGDEIGEFIDKVNNFESTAETKN